MSTKAKTKAASTSAVTHVLIKAITPDPHQPRKAFDEKALQALADNIRERGILQPILVRKEGDKTLIVDGERRWRAAKLAKLTTVPTLRVDMGTYEDSQIRLDQFSVNQLHEKLRPMERAGMLRQMQDAGKTVNDIAAALAKQGHEAMKPAQIAALAALMDLPTWVHDMVNAEEIEAGAAGKLAPLLQIKGIDKPLQARMRKAAGWTGSIKSQNVVTEACDVLSTEFADLNRVESWNSYPVLFAWKSRCKGCEHLLTFEGRGYCRNAKLFKEHQAEAKAEGLLPGGKRPAKAAPVTGKAAEKEVEQKTEQREFTLGEKARNYLHGCLTAALVTPVASRADLQLALVVWRALKSPGTQDTRGSNAIDAEIPGRFASLEVLTTATEGDVVSARLNAALNVLAELPWRETHALARQLAPQLQQLWTLDAAFLDLFRKAELVHLAVKHECNPGDGRLWDRMKADDMKSALLNQAERITRPAILVDLYEGEIDEPYKPWRPGDDDDDGFDDDEDNESFDDE